MKFLVNEKCQENLVKGLLSFEGETLENDVYKFAVEKKIFSGKKGEIFIYVDIEGKNKVALIGLGKKEEINLETLRETFFNLSKELMNKKELGIELEIPKLNNLCSKETFKAVSEGMMQAEYKFDKYLSNKKEIPTLTVSFIVDEEKADKIKDAISEANSLIEGIFLTRDLVNMPAMDLYPETLAEKIVEKLSPLGVKVTVYNKEEIEKIGMEAFLTVGRASSKEPKLIVMEYMNDKNSNEKIGFVGKGVTYDSGGYSIKTSDGMKTMFCDMGGSGTVVGAIYAIAKQKVETNVVGVIAACENMISSDAYKPGDVIGSLSGKTIEIGNTDAEGRLTLADALYYTINTLKVTKVLDLATLTGACLAALGEVYTGAITNDDEWMSSIKKASVKSGEKMWQMPSDDEFRDMNKSEVADIKNVGGRYAGTITAGLFLESFVGNTPWVHLDIAGTAYLSKAQNYLPVGATGIHVKTLYNLVAKQKCSK